MSLDFGGRDSGRPGVGVRGAKPPAKKNSLNFCLACIRKFPGNSLMDPGSDTPGCIRKFPGNFLMHSLRDKKFKIGSLQMIHIWLKKESIRKFPRNSRMDPGVATFLDAHSTKKIL